MFVGRTSHEQLATFQFLIDQFLRVFNFGEYYFFIPKVKSRHQPFIGVEVELCLFFYFNDLSWLQHVGYNSLVEIHFLGHCPELVQQVQVLALCIPVHVAKFSLHIFVVFSELSYDFALAVHLFCQVVVFVIFIQQFLLFNCILLCEFLLPCLLLLKIKLQTTSFSGRYLFFFFKCLPSSYQLLLHLLHKKLHRCQFCHGLFIRSRNSSVGRLADCFVIFGRLFSDLSSRY